MSACDKPRWRYNWMKTFMQAVSEFENHYHATPNTVRMNDRTWGAVVRETDPWEAGSRVDGKVFAFGLEVKTEPNLPDLDIRLSLEHPESLRVWLVEEEP